MDSGPGRKPGSYFGAPAHLRKSVAISAAEPAFAPASEAQARCDAIQAEFRAQQAERPSIHCEPERRKSIRRDPPPLPAALVPTDDALKLRLAEELEYVRRMIEAMGDTLSSDPMVVGRHMTALQTVDIVGQILGHVANVVRSSDPGGAVERIGMCDLKGRLRRMGGL